MSQLQPSGSPGISDADSQSSRPDRRSISCWLVPLICLLVWLGFIPFALRQTHKYSWDSASYIECAQSLVRGEGLTQRTIGGVDTPNWIPMSLWPPGYPILIAAIHALGVPAPQAGVLVSLMSAGLFVLLQAWICQRFLSWGIALPVALAVTCMPALYQVSTNCLSDAAYMAASVGSLAYLIAWSDRATRSWRLLLTAGVLAGMAYAIRTVGIALFVVEAAFLFWQASRARDWGLFFRNAIIWLTAVAVPVLPVLVRNVIVFGTLNPYEMPPSNLTLSDNLRTTWLSLKHDLTASPDFLRHITTKRMFVGALLVAIALGLRFRFKLLSIVRVCVLQAQHRLVAVLVAYAAVFIAVVIAGRTKYWWGETIYWRYLIPVYWIFFLGLASASVALLQALWIPARANTVAVSALFIAIATLQLRAQIRWLGQPPSTFGSLEANYGQSTGQFLASHVPSHQFILACRADLLRIHCGINARAIPGPPFSAASYRRLLTWEEVKQAGQAGNLWGIVILDVQRALDGGYFPWMQEMLTAPEAFPELERVAFDSPARIFKYVGAK